MAISIYKTPDVGKLKKDLNIDELVGSDANSGVPAKEQVDLTHSEKTIVNYVENTLVDECYSQYQDELDKEAKKRRDMSVMDLVIELEHTEKNLNQRVDSFFTETERNLKLHAEDYAKAQKDLKVFKHKNKLDREAIYPESLIFHNAIIAGIVLIETILNAFFLQKGSELGLVGGIVSALLITSVNVGLAFLFATVLRFSWSIELKKKVSGIVGAIVILIIAVAFILLVGHYRDALEGDPFVASKQAAITFVQDPFAIEEFNSWVLVIVSTLAFLFASLKFFSSEDRYPGFTKYARIVSEQRKKWCELCDQASVNHQKMIDQFRQQSTEKSHQIRKNAIEFKQSLHKCDQLIEGYQISNKSLQDLLSELIGFYRELSEKFLSYAANYFSTPVLLDATSRPELNTSAFQSDQEELVAIESRVEKLDETYRNAMEIIDTYRETSQTKINQRIQSIEQQLGIGGR